MHALRIACAALLAFGALSLHAPSASATGQGAFSPEGCERRAARIERLEGLIDRIPRRFGFLRYWVAAWAAGQQRVYTEFCITLNQLQSVGSHNSFPVIPRPNLLEALLFLEPAAAGWEYSHRPLGEQFEEEGVRQIELDGFADPECGLYGSRRGLEILRVDPISPDPEMFEPGMKVLHVQDLDFETTCLTFVLCLEEVKAWSDRRPRHLPIAILVELKDDVLPQSDTLGFVRPVPFWPEELDVIDAEIRSVFPADQLITPDDLRLPKETLETSILEAGWPTLHESRGRILFFMDNGGGKRLDYIEGRPNLEGRVLFTNAPPGAPDAAFVKRNEPRGNEDEIQELVREGYLVRTRADADTEEARTGDTTRRDAALRSGAQFVSTDYPSPETRFGTGYGVTIPDGAPSRCNPVNGPSGCREAWLEPQGRKRARGWRP